MSFITNFKFLNLLIKSKINKKIQHIYVPPEQKNVLITSYSELYAIEYFNEVALQINTSMSVDKELLIKVIQYLIKKNKKIILIEKVRVFNDDDIKYLGMLSNKIYLDQRYIEKTKGIAKNQILNVDITSYKIIIDKLDFFEKVCREYCKNEFEKVIFTIVQLGNYIKYINTLNSNILEPCLVNAFILKNGVCMDFSVALWKCLDRLNIESNIIKGIANSQKTNSIAMFDHAWNQIKIDNKWYNIDLTWFNTTKKIDFVLVDDENFYKNNRHESRFEKKMCRYNYDRQQVENKVKEFEKYKNIFEEFDKGNKSIKLHLVREQ